MITLFFSCAATFRHSRAVWISSVVSKCFKTVKFSDEPFSTYITFDINKTVTILLKINKNNFKIPFFIGFKSRFLGVMIMDISMEFIIQQRQLCCLREHQVSSSFCKWFFYCITRVESTLVWLTIHHSRLIWDESLNDLLSWWCIFGVMSHHLGAKLSCLRLEHSRLLKFIHHLSSLSVSGISENQQKNLE